MKCSLQAEVHTRAGLSISVDHAHKTSDMQGLNKKSAMAAESSNESSGERLGQKEAQGKRFQRLSVQ